MTKINIYRKGKDIVKYTVSGHTEFANAGEDIVCAAISALAMNALNGLTDVVGLLVGYEVRDGYLECILPENLSEEERKSANVLLDSLVLSFENLKKQYGKYITIRKLEV